MTKFTRGGCLDTGGGSGDTGVEDMATEGGVLATRDTGGRGLVSGGSVDTTGGCLATGGGSGDTGGGRLATRAKIWFLGGR